MGPDPREMAESDLIIGWGGNPVTAQVNVMTRIARAPTTAPSSSSSTSTARPAWRPPTTPTSCAGDRCGVRLRADAVLFRDGFADRDYLANFAADAEFGPAAMKQNGRKLSPASRPSGSSISRIFTGAPKKPLSGWLWLFRCTARNNSR